MRIPFLFRASISQIADGVGWKTTMVLVNTDTVPANFTLNFWHGDGSPLSLPLISQGSQQQVTGTIPVNGSVTLETPGPSGTTFSQGWGQLITSNSIGGTTIFRASVAGRQDTEASVPVTKPIGKTLLLPFDNTGPQTSLALVNTDATNTAVITATVYDEAGNVLATGVINLPPQGQQAFGLADPDRFPASNGHRGVANFTSSTVPITGLGLRFSGAPFTSIDMVALP